jgi:enediyne biosynthesis protein E4
MAFGKRAVATFFRPPAAFLFAVSLFAQTSPSIQFTDVTKAAGISFTHYTGAFGKKYLPETLGPGVAFFDYDGDGWQDLFFTNGKDWPGQSRRPSTPHLFRNNRNGTFTDTTRTAGLAIETYALGVAAGDYDNDGDEDLFVTAVGQSLLFRNTNGVFTDVTKEAGLAGHNEFSTSSAWVDATDGLVLHSRWNEQVVLHARILQGSVPASLAKSRQRDV